jgi:dTMP kinase
VRAAYLEIAAAEPDRFLVVDAARPVVDIATEICKRVEPLL